MKRSRPSQPDLGTNPFVTWPAPPTDAEVVKALGPSHAAWARLLAALTADGVYGREWKRLSKASGWTLRALERDRVIVYLSPREGWFLASFALGEAALEAARAEKLPPDVKKAVDEAPYYVEGSAVRIAVRDVRTADAVTRLAVIKRTVSSKR